MTEARKIALTDTSPLKPMISAISFVKYNWQADLYIIGGVVLISPSSSIPTDEAFPSFFFFARFDPRVVDNVEEEEDDDEERPRLDPVSTGDDELLLLLLEPPLLLSLSSSIPTDEVVVVTTDAVMEVVDNCRAVAMERTVPCIGWIYCAV